MSTTVRKPSVKDYLGYRVRIQTIGGLGCSGSGKNADGSGGTELVGQLMAFDKFMNLVIADCEEFRWLKKSNRYERTYVGFTVLRGEAVVSIRTEGNQATMTGGLGDGARPGENIQNRGEMGQVSAQTNGSSAPKSVRRPATHDINAAFE